MSINIDPQQPIPTDDGLCDKTLRDRDHYHDMADKLAEAIAEHFGADIGEHSSANCPWEMALEVIESAPQPQQIPEGYKLVPVELLNFIAAKEHHLPVEDRHCLRIMLEAAPEPKEQP